MPADLDALIAEAEGLCAKLARDEAHCHDYGTSIDIELAFAKGARTLIPELVAALRQRPGREEVERKLSRLYGIGLQAGQADERGQLRLEGHLETVRDTLIADLLRDLGYGAGDGR